MTADVVRGVRHALGIRPVYKTVDTCAAEFAAATPYHYSSYDEETEVAPREKPAVIILGSRPQPDRPGHRVRLLVRARRRSRCREAGYETIMVNCNPETVSTDYDTSDRLYFEPLTLEDVLEIVHAEKQAGPVAGVICQLGGQTPLGLAQGLEDDGVPIVGTSPEAIHLAEERGAFGRVLADAGLPAPKHGMATSLPRRPADRRRDRLPGAGAAVVRPRRSRHGDRLRRRRARGLHRRASTEIGPAHPVLVDRFIDDAVEIDVDALYDGDGALPRRRDGAHRGGRHPLRRLLLRAAADHPRRGRDRPDPRGDRGDRPRASACAGCSTSSSRSAPTCSTCSRPTRAPAARCRSCPRRPRRRWPRRRPG